MNSRTIPMNYFIFVRMRSVHWRVPRAVLTLWHASLFLGLWPVGFLVFSSSFSPLFDWWFPMLFLVRNFLSFIGAFRVCYQY
jgi:hypothetical protein